MPLKKNIVGSVRPYKLTKVKKGKRKVEDNKDNIQVIVRCRPLNAAERRENEDEMVDVDSKNNCLVINKRESKEEHGRRDIFKSKRFTFDAVYDKKATQEEVFYRSVEPMVAEMLNGENVTIFAYGQTGTGKTFTMEGNSVIQGIMQRAFGQIFHYVEHKTACKCQVQCSYLELYRGKVLDLLDRSSEKQGSIHKLSLVSLPYRGQRTERCLTADEMEYWRKRGYNRRVTASTAFNERSSRSHAIFTITFTLYNKHDKIIRYSKLNMVDLAGSETLQNEKTNDISKKECIDINLSLLALNKVILAAVKGISYIPYRDSILTMLLQDSLGGESKTLMIANIGPARRNYQETLTTIEYANKAKGIKNKPIERRATEGREETQLAAEVEKYKLELNKVKIELEHCKSKLQYYEEKVTFVQPLIEEAIDIITEYKREHGTHRVKKQRQEVERKTGREN